MFLQKAVKCWYNNILYKKLRNQINIWERFLHTLLIDALFFYAKLR